MSEMAVVPKAELEDTQSWAIEDTAVYDAHFTNIDREKLDFIYQTMVALKAALAEAASNPMLAAFLPQL